MIEELRSSLHEQVGKAVVGQSDTIDSLLIAMLVGGHVLLEGVPGTAKTLLARAFARATGLSFGRAQFTPDMLPSDLTGTVTLRGGDLVFRPGPVFAHVVLADEINRTPPKTQAAMLEAMSERQVTVDAKSHQLPNPFLVVATQNPVEYEGTYPLPEAQLDRFLMKINLDYPGGDVERRMLQLARSGVEAASVDAISPITSEEQILTIREQVDATQAVDEVLDYVVGVVRSTRNLPAVELGASPRAAVHLLAVAKGRARLAGRDYVTPDDVAEAAPNVLRHRLVLRAEAQLDRYRPDDAVRAALAETPVPR